MHAVAQSGSLLAPQAVNFKVVRSWAQTGLPACMIVSVLSIAAVAVGILCSGRPGHLLSGWRQAPAFKQSPCEHRHTSSTAMAATVGADMLEAGSIEVQRIPALKDNYVWLLQERGSGKVAVVDPSEAAPVAKAVQDRGLKLDYILNTHHHWDHTGGNMELKKQYGCTIVGPAADKDRIPGIDIALKDGDEWEFGQQKMHVFDTPGHTRGHITLWFPKADALFPGDTLFAMGCGRLFEGTPQQMWGSLSKMTPLSPSAQVFCAHEYTQNNAKWATAVDPDNVKLQQRKEAVDRMRSQNAPTIPSTLQDELDTNPFLRPNDLGIRKNLGIPADASDLDAFTAIRKHKDNF